MECRARDGFTMTGHRPGCAMGGPTPTMIPRGIGVLPWHPTVAIPGAEPRPTT